MSDETAITDLVIIEPVQAIARAKRHSDIVRTMRQDNVLRQGSDYGTIPGTNKPTLLKPGAERLCAAFGLSPDFEALNSIENWDDDKPLFHYQYKCNLIHIESGKLLATGIGSCNSMESKYRWRWLWDNQVVGMDTSDMVTKKTRSGKTQYRAANDDVFSIVNTVDKMAQKRALIAAVLIGCNASDHFTQDIEDMPGFGTADIVDAEFEDVKPTAQKTQPEPLQPEFFVWNEANRNKLYGYWQQHELTKHDTLTFAGIIDETNMEEWKKYPTPKEASAAIQIAWNVELAKKVQPTTPTDTPEADVDF